MIWESYAVLANLSASYSPLEGRSPMYSSPVRRFTSVLLHLLARLACIRRAASVRSEPGSNSQIGVLRIWTKGHHFNTPYTLLNFLYSVVKEQRVHHASRAIYNLHDHVSRDPLKKLRVVSLWYRTVTRRQARSSGRNATTIERLQDSKPSELSQEGNFSIKLFPEQKNSWEVMPYKTA
jgi:hypothetical protein